MFGHRRGNGRPRHRLRACRAPIAGALLLILSGCASTGHLAGREQLDVFTNDAGIIEKSLKKNPDSPTEVLIDAVRLPGANRRSLRGALADARANFEAKGITGLGVHSSFPPTDCAPTPCASGFCAGVAARSLNPTTFLPALADEPTNFLLRLFTGDSEPPLAGFGGRARSNLVGLLIRLVFRDQYFAHLFKDSTEESSSGPVNQVKALALLDDGGNKLYWVRVDMIGAFQDLRAKVIQDLRDQGVCDINDGNLLLSGTHTHSGLGAVNPRWLFAIASVDLFRQDLFDRVADRIVETIVAANADLGPAKLGTGEGLNSTTITAHRREHCEWDDPDNNLDPNPTVGVVRIDRPGTPDTPLATLFNFSIHPTSMGESNFELHPDSVGWAEKNVEQQVGGVALFFNGTEGDVKPAIAPAQTVGEQLANTVVAERNAITPTDQVKLHSTYCQLDDPEVEPNYPTSCAHKLEPAQIRPLMNVPNPLAPEGCFIDRGEFHLVITIAKEDDPPILEREGVVMAAHRIDTGSGASLKKTLIVTLPGEAITGVGNEIRTELATDYDDDDDIWVFGLSNAHMGYIVTEAEYMEGGYESFSNMFGKTEGAVFRDNAVDLGSQLSSP